MSKSIVFDCDGTLIASMGTIFAGLAQALSRALGREVSQLEVIKNYDAHIEITFERFGISKETMGPILEDWSFSTLPGRSEYSLFPGIKELLQRLSDEGHILYVWTARDRHSTTQILQSLGVLRYFEDLRTSTDCAVKPNPEGLSQLLRGIDPQSCCVIGDSYTDIIGAKKFGITAIGATWCANSLAADLEQSGADILVSSTQECYDAINRFVRG